MKAFILIHASQGSIHEVVRFLKRTNGVTEAYFTFGPYDAIAEVEADDINGVADVVYKEIQAIPGVEETLTCLALNINS